MKVLNVEHRDIHVTVDFSLDQLKHLRTFLSHVEFTYNGEENPELQKADKYITELLYPFLDQFIDNIESQG